LADWNFLAYLTNTYGTKIHLPEANLFTSVFQNEQSSSAGASPATIVKRMNSALAWHIFDQNPRNEVFVHPYWIFDWMYPRVVPEGPLLKICRDPLPSLPPDSVKANRQYWSGICGKLIGDWISEATTPKEVCDFVEKVYLRHDLSDFKGDPGYVSDTRAQEQFAQFRFVTADLYHWRCVQATQLEEKYWMQNEGLVAYMQAFALGPRNSTVAYYFAEALALINYNDEALQILEICISLQPADSDLKEKRDEIRAKAKSAGSN
jgi:hypothetical protein